MLDLLMTMGQAASTMLLIYGAFLVMMPHRPSRQEKPLLLKPLRSDA